MENSFILSLVDILYEMDKIGRVMKKGDGLTISRSSFFSFLLRILGVGRGDWLAREG